MGASLSVTVVCKHKVTPPGSITQARQGIGISGMASGWVAGPETDSEGDSADEQLQSGEAARPHFLVGMGLLASRILTAGVLS